MKKSNQITAPDNIIPEVELKSLHRKRKRKQRFIRYFSVYLENDAYEEFKTRAAAEHHSISRLARHCIMHTQGRALPVPVQETILTALEVAFVHARQLQLEFKPGSTFFTEIQRICEALGVIRDSVRQIAIPRVNGHDQKGKI